MFWFRSREGTYELQCPLHLLPDKPNSSSCASHFFQPLYHFCGCFWHRPQFFNFLLKTWASEQYSMFQLRARQLRHCLISRTISSVSASEEGEGEEGGILGSKLCFIEGPLLWDSHSFPSYRNQPLSEQICFHKLPPRSAGRPCLVPSRTPDWAALGFGWFGVCLCILQICTRKA